MTRDQLILKAIKKLETLTVKELKDFVKVPKMWSCERCEINSIADPERWIPCPRGECEAKYVKVK